MGVGCNRVWGCNYSRLGCGVYGVVGCLEVAWRLQCGVQVCQPKVREEIALGIEQEAKARKVYWSGTFVAESASRAKVRKVFGLGWVVAVDRRRVALEALKGLWGWEASPLRS